VSSKTLKYSIWDDEDEESEIEEDELDEETLELDEFCVSSSITIPFDIEIYVDAINVDSPDIPEAAPTSC
jgi:hypothetical protein